MSEAGWLSETDPRAMRVYLGPEASGRKLRLFAVATCRLVWDLLAEPRSRHQILTGERLADGLTEDPVRAAEIAADETKVAAAVRDGMPPSWANDDSRLLRGLAAQCVRPDARAAAAAVVAAFQWCDWVRFLDPDAAEPFQASRTGDPARFMPARQCGLLRELFGNPFRAVVLSSAWRTSDVLALARGIYDDRAYDRMPILADALRDAGCGVDELLAHFRDPLAMHVRGCWALDLVLGYE